jgi:hypothetical protein
MRIIVICVTYIAALLDLEVNSVKKIKVYAIDEQKTHQINVFNVN